MRTWIGLVMLLHHINPAPSFNLRPLSFTFMFFAVVKVHMNLINLAIFYHPY